ncbi:hypothetical protein BCV70DRAFT_27798 [Testicularia cyperi]|uniref:Uncharacterized protein n=1 Tax=Testicularia cyperi TaxID=1882483 RepID=A0A317XN39_9BASI|nr:hypothetical protein BCV70DRAFT_27798 [Testicularia cyperi]
MPGDRLSLAPQARKSEKTDLLDPVVCSCSVRWSWLSLSVCCIHAAQPTNQRPRFEPKGTVMGSPLTLAAPLFFLLLPEQEGSYCTVLCKVLAKLSPRGVKYCTVLSCIVAR